MKAALVELSGYLSALLVNIIGVCVCMWGGGGGGKGAHCHGDDHSTFYMYNLLVLTFSDIKQLSTSPIIHSKVHATPPGCNSNKVPVY